MSSDDDPCPVCGADSVFGTYCSCECARRGEDIPKRIGWQCDLCGFSSTGDSAHDDLVEHLVDHHSDRFKSVDTLQRVGLASVWFLVSRVTTDPGQQTLAAGGGVSGAE